MTTKGFALIEGTVVALLMIVLVGGLFLVLYLSFTKVWVKSALYDGLICVQEHRAAQECRRQVRERIRYLPWGEILDLKLEPRSEGEVRLQIRDNLSFQIRQSLPESLK